MDVGRELPAVTKIIQRVETDQKAFEDVKDSVAELARIILSDDIMARGEQWKAREELDWRLRQATGVAKAPYVADFIRLLVESGERVLVYCWHRAVYDILQSKLKDFLPAMYTGSETTNEKVEAKRRFVEEKSTPVMLMSLRAGAGIDGMQKVCRTVVVAELDWSPGVIEQDVGRVYRDGQTDPVTVYFMVTDEGSDPVVSETLGLKREQIEGLRDPNVPPMEELQPTEDRVKKLAEQYLKKHGFAHSPHTKIATADGLRS